MNRKSGTAIGLGMAALAAAGIAAAPAALAQSDPSGDTATNVAEQIQTNAIEAVDSVVAAEQSNLGLIEQSATAVTELFHFPWP